jgi:hypothetical protein
MKKFSCLFRLNGNFSLRAKRSVFLEPETPQPDPLTEGITSMKNSADHFKEAVNAMDNSALKKANVTELAANAEHELGIAYSEHDAQLHKSGTEEDTENLAREKEKLVDELHDLARQKEKEQQQIGEFYVEEATWTDRNEKADTFVKAMIENLGSKDFDLFQGNIASATDLSKNIQGTIKILEALRETTNKTLQKQIDTSLEGWRGLVTWLDENTTAATTILNTYKREQALRARANGESARNGGVANEAAKEYWTEADTLKAQLAEQMAKFGASPGDDGEKAKGEEADPPDAEADKQPASDPEAAPAKEPPDSGDDDDEEEPPSRDPV